MDNSTVDDTEIQILDRLSEESEMLESLKPKPKYRCYIHGIAETSELATFLEDYQFFIVDPKQNEELFTGIIYDGSCFCRVRMIKDDCSIFTFYDEHSHIKICFALSDYFRKKRQKYNFH